MALTAAGRWAVVSTLLLPGWAVADEADQAVPPATPLPAVVVTGTRQSSSALDLAGNTSVIDQGQIDFAAPQRPAEILNRVPGVNIQQGSGEEHLTAIRSPALNGGAGAGSFLYLEDGVPLRAAGFANINGLMEANVEQAGSVEVVRGPGSALYGSNAVHGLINVIPRAPSKDFAGEVDVTLGSNVRDRVMGTVTGGTDDNAARLSALYNHDGGWRFHTGLDEQKFVFRDVWTGTADTITSTVSGQNLDQDTGGYVLGKDNYKNSGIAKSNQEPEAYRRVHSVRAMTRWQHDLNDWAQLSLTPYARNSEMQFVQHYLPDKAVEHNAHVSGGLQSALYMALPGGHSVIAGTDVEYTDGWLSEVQDLPSLANGYVHGEHYNFNVQGVVTAPYLHSEWQLPAHLRLTAGVRLENTAYDYTNNISSGIFGRFYRVPDRSDSFTTVTPKLGLVEQWRPWLASYVNLSRGARAPQVSDLYELQSHQVPGQIKPETLDSLEIGSRGTVRQVRFEVAAYWMEKHHFFYRDADGFNVPDGVTRHRGVEVDLWRPLPADFDIGAAFSYALHSYEFNRPVSSTVNLADSVTKGNEMAEAPRVLANLRLGYTPLPGTRIEIEWVHVGPYYLDAANFHSYSGHDLVNLRAETKLSERLSLHAKVLNLTNVAYADRAAFSNGQYQYFPGAPIAVLAGATAKF